MADTSTVLKRALLGRPRASRELKHQLLPKWMALPVFSSDPLSSVAYATQEMMFVLVLAGAGAFGLVRPLALGVAALLIIVITSYRQTVRAYPRGGGAYRVSRDNLGDKPGLVAASAILIDYVLTVAVSIAAGVAAITSAATALAPYRVPLALTFVVLVTIANLRGVKEAGLLFAFPTYTFVATMFALIGTGLVRCLSECPAAPSAGTPVEAEAALTIALVLRAFSSGATALTGVEAISDGVQAFRYPQSRNAADTLAIMGTLAVLMFLGISYLATATGVVATEGMERTVNAEIALAVFGDGLGFYMVQIVTAAILILAANTAYADFPRLGSILAGDRFLPKQLLARGDRLVFSNGILVLAGFACLLLVAFSADVTRLIQLYVVGVFTAFTLSQTGMVRHWQRLRGRNWRRSALINGVGAATTAVVLVVVGISKFTHGAWIVVVAIPILVMAMSWVHRHYERVSLSLRAGMAELEPARPNHFVILLDRVDESVCRAIAYARFTGAASVQALAVPLAGLDVERDWAAVAQDIPLRVLSRADAPGVVGNLRTAVVAEARRHTGAFTTAVVTETASNSWIDQIRHHRLALRVKADLLGEPEVVVTDVVAPADGPSPPRVSEPVEHHVIVLVSAVHKASMRALAYAEGLQATSLRALSINLEAERSGQILQDWDDWAIDIALELLDSPFRSITTSMVGYLRNFQPDGVHTVVSVVLPDVLQPRWYHQPLHNQTALQIKKTLLFERGVVVTSVPYLLTPTEDASAAAVPAARAGR